MIVALALIGLVPLLLGLLFELVVVAPLRVPLDQTPLFFPWQVSIRSCVLGPSVRSVESTISFCFRRTGLWACSI